MRIAMFTETFLPNTDGIVTRLSATLKYLEQEGHEVLLFAPEGAPAKFGAAKIVGIPAKPFFLYPEKRFALPSPRIRRHLEAFGPDLIHVINPALLGVGGVYYARRYRIPLVASYHTNVPMYAKHYHLDFLEPVLWWYFRTLHNQATVNLCTSTAMQTVLNEKNFRNVNLWDRGVDVDLFQSTKQSPEMRRRLAPGAEDKFLLLYVGRLATEKEIHRLRPVLDRLPNVHLAIVGDGPQRAELEEKFQGANVSFIGYLHGEELASAYASADAFVFPSTTETLGLVLFEAMASGLPILAAGSAPTREVLMGGKAGFIFPQHDVDGAVRTVERLMTDAEARDRVISAALNLARELDWRRPTKQLLEHYYAVCPVAELTRRELVQELT